MPLHLEYVLSWEMLWLVIHGLCDMLSICITQLIITVICIRVEIKQLQREQKNIFLPVSLGEMD